MNADLSDAARDTERALTLGQSDDHSRGIAAQPAVDREHASANVVFNAIQPFKILLMMDSVIYGRFQRKQKRRSLPN